MQCTFEVDEPTFTRDGNVVFFPQKTVWNHDSGLRTIKIILQFKQSVWTCLAKSQSCTNLLSVIPPSSKRDALESVKPLPENLLVKHIAQHFESRPPSRIKLSGLNRVHLVSMKARSKPFVRDPPPSAAAASSWRSAFTHLQKREEGGRSELGPHRFGSVQTSCILSPI